MKKTFSVFLIVVMMLSFCACGEKAPSIEDKLESDAILYVGLSVKNSLGDSIVGSPVVEITYLAHNDDVWAALGTVTVISADSRNPVSIKFGVSAKYNEQTDKFSFYDLEFED